MTSYSTIFHYTLLYYILLSHTVLYCFLVGYVLPYYGISWVLPHNELSAFIFLLLASSINIHHKRWMKTNVSAIATTAISGASYTRYTPRPPCQPRAQVASAVPSSPGAVPRPSNKWSIMSCSSCKLAYRGCGSTTAAARSYVWKWRRRSWQPPFAGTG